MSLVNGGFEAEWSGHDCLVCLPDGGTEIREVGNIFNPGGWTTWFLHDPGKWDQPEVTDAWKSADPDRVRSGEKGVKFFTFGRNHKGGLFQRVQVTPGQRLRFSAYAHAWSNHKDGPHPHDGNWSEGAPIVGENKVSLTKAQIPPLNGEQQNDAVGNFKFRVGIDPTGGLDPMADSVVWGEPRWNYNGYTEPLTVEATAQADAVTVFLFSRTMWQFTHNDAYWDDASLVVVEEPEPEEPEEPEPEPEPEPEEPEAGRGDPRVQYERTYVLLPPGADAVLATAVQIAAQDYQYTVGYSADDAGIGDLDRRRVIAVAPEAWGDDLEGFFRAYYAGVSYLPISAGEAEGGLPGPGVWPDPLEPEPEEPEEPEPEEPEEPEPEPEGPDTMVRVGMHLQTMSGGYEAYYEQVRPSVAKVTCSMHDVAGIKRLCLETAVVWRHVNDDYDNTWCLPDPVEGARRWVDEFRDSLYDRCDDLAREFPGLAEPFFYAESVNEKYDTLKPDQLAHSIAFDIAFINEIESLGLPVKPCVFTAAVGNPHETEFEELVPLARRCAEVGGLMGYHNYWHAFDGESLLVAEWPYGAGRWTEMDKVFVEHGVYVRWFGGESGAHANAWGGWKDDECYNGDWSKYEADIIQFNRLIQEWNSTHGNRHLGSVLFTTGSSFTGWPSFQIRDAEVARLIEVLG